MQLKNVAKAIAAGALAAVMAGATVGFAATLADFPAPFITDGNVDTLIVVGSKPTAYVADRVKDIAGAINIAARLGSVPGETRTLTASGVTTTTVSGGVALETENTKLYLDSNIDDAKEALTSEDLPTLLASGTFTDDAGEEYEYDQYIYPGTLPIVFGKPDDLDDPVVYVNTGSSTIYTATVVFNDEINFSSSDVQGNDIKLFGKDFTIGSGSTNTDIILYAAAQDVTVAPGEEQTVEFDGKTFTIKVIGIDTSDSAHPKATIEINGNSYTRTQGSEIKVSGVTFTLKEVNAYTVPENTGSVKLSIGSEKYELKNGTGVYKDDEKIDGIGVTITGDPVSKIEFTVSEDDTDDQYITADHPFEDPIFGFKVSMADVDLTAGKAEFDIGTSGEEIATVKLTDWKGNTKTVEWAYDSRGTVSLEDGDQKDIMTYEGETVEEKGYLLINTNDFSHLLQITDISSDKLTLKDVFTDTTYEVDISSNTGTKVIDGYTYTFTINTTANTAKVEWDSSYKYIYPTLKLKNDMEVAFIEPVNVSGMSGTLSLPECTIDVSSLTDDGNLTGLGGNGELCSYFFFDNSTKEVGLRNGTAVLDKPAILFIEESNDDVSRNVVAVYAKDDDQKITVDNVLYPSVTFYQTSDSDVYEGLTQFGTLIVKNTEDQGSVKIYYPDEPVTYHVAVGENPTWSTSGGEGGTVTYKEVVPITTSIAKLDSEVTDSDKNTKNLILVGGPCANSLVQELVDSGKLGDEYTCAGGTPGSAWEPDTGYIMLVNDAFATGKAALIVAGSTAEETYQACSILQDYEAHASELTGTAVKIVNNVITPITMSE